MYINVYPQFQTIGDTPRRLLAWIGTPATPKAPQLAHSESMAPGRGQPGGRFHKVKTSEQTAEEAERAKERKKRLEERREQFDIRRLDLFGYEPRYTFPGHRTIFGALTSVFLAGAVFLRLTVQTWDFLFPEALITENRMLFANDLQDEFTLPKLGVVFKRNGWKPFYDPTYFTFRFQQGHSGRASNSTYSDLGEQLCSFVDAHGRIREDEARCPAIEGHVLGNFFDEKYVPYHPLISYIRPTNLQDFAQERFKSDQFNDSNLSPPSKSHPNATKHIHSSPPGKNPDPNKYIHTKQG